MSENLIEKVLCAHIEERNAFFVFPTQTAADLWADRATLVTSVTAVAMERFIAWDSFKSESIRSIHQDKKSVPSTMRKVFASYIIKANAKEHFLTYIITQEYSKCAERFTDWISKLLPQLALWKRLFDASGKAPDEEDKDFMQLYERYSAFLEEFGFFDPAWETPPFKADGKKYFIFFPEILSDYIEYEAVLRSSPDITIVNLPTVAPGAFSSAVSSGSAEPVSAGATNPDGATDSASSVAPVLFFNNSRTEIKHVATFIAELHEKKNIPWTEIAVSVPDMESYGAYIARELSLYEIPYKVRNAAALSADGAGCVFSQIAQCAATGCGYGSLYALLLNSELPWKDIEKNRRLLEFGRENHCICNFEYNDSSIDVWEKSFDDIPDVAENSSVKTYLRGYYRALRSSIKKLAESGSFEKLRENYFAFRESFFNMAECSARSDLILSRCIKELGSLIDLEKEYFDAGSAYKPDSPFSFFTDYISGIQYLEQTDRTGVQVLPYKLASCAPFACHVVVDASQSSVSVVYDELSFLQEDKRKYLTQREEINCTEEFLRLYSMNSTDVEVHFTAAEKTFTGYAQTSSCLKEVDKRKETDESELFYENPYASEKRWLLSDGADGLPDAVNFPFPKRIPESVKNSFENWLSANQNEPEQEHPANPAEPTEPVQSYSATCSNAVKKAGTRAISKTRLSDFFFCPYSWLLKYGFNLNEQDDAATLMNQYAYGNLFHKICECFLKSVKAANIPLHAESEKLPDAYYKMLLTSIDEAIISINPYKNIYENSYLVREILKTTKNAIINKMYDTMSRFCKVFEGCLVDEVETEYTVEIPGKSYKCTGRIDCLLREAESGRYILVDFKTGEIPKKKLYLDSDEQETDETSENFEPDVENAENGGNKTDEKPETLPLFQQNLPDFQMPMYVLLLKHGEKKISVQNACFFSLKDNEEAKKNPVVTVFGEDIFRRNPPAERARKNTEVVTPEEFMPVVEKLVECMDYYSESIESGKIETDPEVHNFMRCIECTYKGLCRKTFNVGKKD